MFNRTNRDRKSHLSGILTEPLNPRGSIILILLETIKTSFSKYCTVVSGGNINYSVLPRL